MTYGDALKCLTKAGPFDARRAVWPKNWRLASQFRDVSGGGFQVTQCELQLWDWGQGVCTPWHPTADDINATDWEAL